MKRYLLVPAAYMSKIMMWMISYLWICGYHISSMVLFRDYMQSLIIVVCLTVSVYSQIANELCSFYYLYHTIAQENTFYLCKAGQKANK